MTTMRPPTMPEQAVPVLPVEDLRKPLKPARGGTSSSWGTRRSSGSCSSRMSGMRRAEVIGLTVGSSDLDSDVAVAVGKGRRPRGIPYGHEPGRH